MTREQLVAQVIKLRTAIRGPATAQDTTRAGIIRTSGGLCQNRSSQTSRSRRGHSSCVDALRTASRSMSKHQRPGRTTRSIGNRPTDGSINDQLLEPRQAPLAGAQPRGRSDQLGEERIADGEGATSGVVRPGLTRRSSAARSSSLLASRSRASSTCSKPMYGCANRSASCSAAVNSSSETEPALINCRTRRVGPWVTHQLSVSESAIDDRPPGTAGSAGHDLRVPEVGDGE